MITIQLYRTITGQWRWRARANNGRKIAHGGEAYKNRNDALSAIRLLFTNSEQIVLDQPGADTPTTIAMPYKGAS